MAHAEDRFGARIALTVGFTVLCALVVAQRVASNEHRAPRSANGGQQANASNADGKQVFESRCAGCHGLDGRGGERAPDIASSAKTQQRSDDELYRIIERGVPGTGMPAFGPTGANLKDVVAFLRQLQGKSDSAKLPGNAHKGRELFYGRARCSECHAIAGSGGFIASELSGFGRSRSPDEIRQAIVKPGGANRLGGKITVKLRDGKEYTGVVRNEDNFSLQLQSLDGDFHLFQKSEIAGFSRQKDSLMPADYGTTLDPEELNDLISFLMSAARDATTNASSRKKFEDDEVE